MQHPITCNECHHHTRMVEQVKSLMPDDERLFDLAEFFKMFADSTRIRILAALMGGEICVCDISEALGMNQSAVSHQLRLLRAHRLVKTRRDGKSVFYSLDDEHVATMLSQGIEHLCEDGNER